MATSTDDARWSVTRVLLVDDDEGDRLLAQRSLRRYRPAAVEGGKEALEWIEENGLPEVVITDQFMRGMDGLELLRELRERYPEVVRVLLTGHADLELALSSVNEGQVFQIALKHWPRERLVKAAEAALRHAELLRTEREVIQKTLTGAVSALGEALALANPVALGHTLRVVKKVDALAARLEAPRPWEITIASQLSQLGTVHIPAGVLERALLERDLKEWEVELYAGAPQRAFDILKNIPRLEGVRQIIRWQHARFDGRTRGAPKADAIPLGSRILHVAVAADRLEMQGNPPEAALAAMMQQKGVYDPEVLEVLRGVLEEARVPSGFVRKTVRMTKLYSGMVFAEDVYTEKGLLLTSKGTTASPGLLERIRGFALAHGIQEVVEMFVPTNPERLPQSY